MMNTNSTEQHGAITLGIDIGTTTVSAVVYDIDNKKQCSTFTQPHNAYVHTDIRSEQSVAVIMETAQALLEQMLANHSKIVSIGLSGQMHGIVYIDADGNPCSNLINWQDKRADQPGKDGRTTVERIKAITGEPISTGYGIATHYDNQLNGLVPPEAVGFCSIMDLFGMKICGTKKAVTHTSVAASFGLFDLKAGCFMADKLAQLEISPVFLPAVTAQNHIIGTYKGIPVSVALGDNQASFLGSVGNHEDGLLVNIGTGSQVSAVSDYGIPSPETELRPFIAGKYLTCGSALCGGFAYAMLEQFFRSYTVSAGMDEEAQYSLMNQLAAEAYAAGEEGLCVDVSFLGKRHDPGCRGSISMIGRQNFTPPALTLGVLKGMCSELYDLYANFGEKKAHIIASGGAVKKNPLLQTLIAACFGMPVSVNTIDEEAATGAALFAAWAVGRIDYHNGFAEYIHNK